ncbi:hypothetical protein G3479_07305 [Shewanella baltica]|uniref:hypothetical protein n=1 Tax=Shewanella baltica TaxID=62322 RepID=UPI00217E2DB5|nr:hypothetical protein [Shewanella baltica]MCS6259060.1 hypothetical protein [Shewanella baltica]
MKSKDLSQVLELACQILSYYEDENVTDALKDILHMCEERKSSTNKKLKDKNRSKSGIDSELRERFYSETKGLSIPEIQTYLNDKTQFPNISSLQHLAERIGLKGLSRANRDNIIHSILKAIERSQIDQTISERKTTSLAE